MTLLRPALAALLCALALPVAAADPRAQDRPRFSGELRLGLGRLPGSDGTDPRSTLIAGGRIALAIETRPDIGPRLGVVVEIEGSGPSGPWRN